MGKVPLNRENLVEQKSSNLFFTKMSTRGAIGARLETSRKCAYTPVVKDSAGGRKPVFVLPATMEKIGIWIRKWVRDSRPPWGRGSVQSSEC